jgi:CheY-like chemotaxis protein
MNKKRTPRILIVEDDDVSTLYLTLLLEQFDCDILKSSSGAAAVELCKNNPDLDLILMDIRMPGMNGYQATQAIREFNKSVIIIAQTAYTLKVDKERAYQAGCNNFISKPIVGDELLAMLKEALQ